jgi:hypothetical protein
MPVQHVPTWLSSDAAPLGSSQQMSHMHGRGRRAGVAKMLSAITCTRGSGRTICSSRRARTMVSHGTVHNRITLSILSCSHASLFSIHACPFKKVDIDYLHWRVVRDPAISIVSQDHIPCLRLAPLGIDTGSDMYCMYTARDGPEGISQGLH